MSLFTDVITGGSSSHQTTSETANYFATDFVAAGIVGAVGNTGGIAPCTGGFAVNAQASPNNTVAISTGQIYVQATPTGQGSQMLRVHNTTVINQTITANTSGATKYDWVYISIDPNNAVNPDAAADNVAAVNVSRSTSATTDNGTPPAFGTLIAVITVANGFSTITNGNISDRRTQTTLSTGSSVQSGWTPLPATLTYSSNNGVKEFVVNTSADLTSILSPGMRLKIGRGTTTPTQCMGFTSASSQYATRASASVSGISFTNAFTCEAWVYMNSYSSGAIISRWDSTNGFLLYTTSTGQLIVQVGTGSGTYRNATSYRSIPLKRWMHVAGALTPSSGTGALYFNGELLPLVVAGAATSLTQAGNLQIGAMNSASFFDGYISEARVWSVAQSQANIQANMAINLTGTETNLVALFQGNGNFNDSTANANHLTATNGAIATQADNPLRATEFAIITKVTSTQLTLFTGTDYTIPNIALLNPYYSNTRAPYGFPNSSNKWMVDSLFVGRFNNSGGASGTIFNLGHTIALPIGEWKGDGRGHMIGTFSSPVSFAATACGLSTATNSITETDTIVSSPVTSNTCTEQDTDFCFTDKAMTITSQTVYYLNICSLVVNCNGLYIGQTGSTPNAQTRLRFVSAYF